MSNYTYPITIKRKSKLRETIMALVKGHKYDRNTILRSCKPDVIKNINRFTETTTELLLSNDPVKKSGFLLTAAETTESKDAQESIDFIAQHLEGAAYNEWIADPKSRDEHLRLAREMNDITKENILSHTIKQCNKQNILSKNFQECMEILTIATIEKLKEKIKKGGTSCSTLHPGR